MEIEAHHPREECFGGLGRCRHRRGRIQCPAGAGQMLGAVAVGEQPEMADPHEALGEDMQEEPADKLLGGEVHGFGLIAMGVVAPSEEDRSLF